MPASSRKAGSRSCSACGLGAREDEAGINPTGDEQRYAQSGERGDAPEAFEAAEIEQEDLYDGEQHDAERSEAQWLAVEPRAGAECAKGEHQQGTGIAVALDWARGALQQVRMEQMPDINQQAGDDQEAADRYCRPAQWRDGAEEMRQGPAPASRGG